VWSILAQQSVEGKEREEEIAENFCGERFIFVWLGRAAKIPF